MEKADDKLPKIVISAGEDNARDILCKARMLLRPPVLEIEDFMASMPTKWEAIIRNLPLEIYGLNDSVNTKAIELCHNLSSSLEIKMFAANNMQVSAQGTKQRAVSGKDGYMEIEVTDSYGDLHTTWDVVMAWITLSAIWQKLHPHWPVATIGLKVIFAQKLFTHCGREDKKVMVEFSNKYLKASSARAAANKPPMSYEATVNVAGNVCKDRGYEREPPAWRAEPNNAASHGLVRGGDRGGGQSRGGRGGRGGANNTNPPSGVQNLGNGSKTCGYWQTGTCFSQNQASCTRNGRTYMHVCAYVKTGGQVCGKSDHKKSEHDPSKH